MGPGPTAFLFCTREGRVAVTAALATRQDTKQHKQETLSPF